MSDDISPDVSPDVSPDISPDLSPDIANDTSTWGTFVYATTTPEPPLTLKWWGLMFIFAVIIVMTLLWILCMILLVVFGCLSSFLCIRCRRNPDETET